MRQNIINTHLVDCFLIEKDSFVDKRGIFIQNFTLRDLKPYIKGKLPIEQGNLSFSRPKVFRGLHIQRDNPQSKLVTCIKGRILDIVVDLRPKSKSYKQWGAFELNGPEKSIYIPEGFAHGFYSYKASIVAYQCGGYWEKDLDGGINIRDEELKIPLPIHSIIISDKDKALPTMAEWIHSNTRIKNG